MKVKLSARVGGADVLDVFDVFDGGHANSEE